MGFSSWLCSKTEKSIPAFPHAGRPVEESTVVLVLPDDSTVIGIYDGYGSVDGTDVYEAVGHHVLGDSDRDNVFNNQKHFTNGDTKFSVNKFNWGEPLVHTNAINGTKIPKEYLNKSMNALIQDGWKYTNNFHDVMAAVKLVVEDDYKGEKYKDLPVSKSCPNQGFFYEE